MGINWSRSKTPTKVIAVIPNIIPEHIIYPVVPHHSFYNHFGPSPREAREPTPPREKREPIPKAIRNFVWVKYHGENNTGVCYCCGTSIQRYNANWHCSHVVAVAKGGETVVENLRTCCRHCNLSMGDQNLYAYIEEKKLTGPGAKNVDTYFQRHIMEVGDRRTNNWGKRGNPTRKFAGRKTVT